MNLSSKLFAEPIDPQQLAAVIDHTLLKADATEAQIHALCQETVDYRFASVCVNPVWVPYCAAQLRDAKIPICTVIGFPLGASQTRIKAEEAKLAISQGATEIDMVMCIGRFKSGLFEKVQEDIAAVVAASAPHLVKVILETCLLREDEIIRACELAVAAGAEYVKTSTGFAAAGAKADHIRLMRQTVGAEIGVKASGGIRDLATALEMIHAGASRIGASASISILRQVQNREYKNET